MKKIRTVKAQVSSVALQEGAGVKVYRSIGTSALKNLDPFLLLDFFCSDNPDDYIGGFPDHPHRGFITLTYMLDGHMEHQDNMGNKGDLQAGSVQWMKAGKGVIHSEMPQQVQGLMRGFQLWLNLPAHEKMTAPEYQEFDAKEIPQIKVESSVIKLISGFHKDASGPVIDKNTALSYRDIHLQPEAGFEVDVDETATVFLYVFEGTIKMLETLVLSHTLIVLGEGNTVALNAAEQGARLILVSGSPIHEPIVQQGPFVMNTQEEIMQAFSDYQAGRLTE